MKRSLPRSLSEVRSPKSCTRLVSTGRVKSGRSDPAGSEPERVGSMGGVVRRASVGGVVRRASAGGVVRRASVGDVVIAESVGVMPRRYCWAISRKSETSWKSFPDKDQISRESES